MPLIAAVFDKYFVILRPHIKNILWQMRDMILYTVSHFEERDLPTGFEAYLLTSMSLTEAKKTACHIEDQHPLGRLFDIDVIDKTGNPLPRTAIGKLPRRCMLCDNEARHCMRNNSHSYEDLQLHIKKLVDNYV